MMFIQGLFVSVSQQQLPPLAGQHALVSKGLYTHFTVRCHTISPVSAAMACLPEPPINHLLPSLPPLTRSLDCPCIAHTHTRARMHAQAYTCTSAHTHLPINLTHRLIPISPAIISPCPRSRPRTPTATLLVPVAAGRGGGACSAPSTPTRYAPCLSPARTSSCG